MQFDQGFKRISIALATFNGGKYLEEQIHSLQSQTWPNIEIIISDDHSTDATMAILQQLASQYNNITVVTNSKTCGYLKNFENAIEHCTGEYIALCDQDDIWLPDKLQKQINLIGLSDLVATDLMIVDEVGKQIAVSLKEYQQFYHPSNNDYFKFIVLRNCFTGMTMLMKSDFVKKCLPVPEDSLVHDWWFAINAAAGNGIVFINEPLVKYRQHGGNAIGAQKNDKSFRRGIVYLFSKERKKYMHDRFSSYQKRVRSYIDREVYRDNADFVFLKAAEKYYAGYLSFFGKWSTMVNGFKIRKYLYPRDCLPVVCVKLLVKLF